MAKRLKIVNGRRFGCTQCGNCCAAPGFVYITPRELEGMAAHVDMEIAAFRAAFRVEWDSDSEHFSIEAKEGQPCSLLDDSRRCRVHPVKPVQCATWPFWDELLDDKREWERSKSYCPGLDAKGGRLYSEREIREIQKSQKTTDEALADYGTNV